MIENDYPQRRTAPSIEATGYQVAYVWLHVSRMTSWQAAIEWVAYLRDEAEKTIELIQYYGSDITGHAVQILSVATDAVFAFREQMNTEAAVIRNYAERAGYDPRALLMYPEARSWGDDVFDRIELPLISWMDDSATGKDALRRFLADLQDAGILRYSSPHAVLSHFTVGASNKPDTRRIAWLQSLGQLIAFWDAAAKAGYLDARRYAALSAIHFEHDGGRPISAGAMRATRATVDPTSEPYQLTYQTVLEILNSL